MKIKEIYNSGLKLLHDLTPIIKYFERKIGLQFNKNVLVVEKKNYLTKTMNVYIVYDLDYWSRNLLSNFRLTKCFVVSTFWSLVITLLGMV